MIVSSAYRRPLQIMALAVCSLTFAVAASPASARPHHGAGRHARAYHAGHHAKRHLAAHHYRHYRHVARAERFERRAALMHARGLENAQASVAPTQTSGETTMTGGFGSSTLVSEARRYLGGNPTSRASLWCARFMNMVLERTGHHGTGSDMASSFARYGQRVSGPQVGAIAVMGRRGGGHVGIITGIDAKGNPIMISGNNGNRVREAPVSRGRIYAYVMPN
jgi:uncharacterized protein (TIGR02594 family)